jgi:anaerobic dimethyl sulfoxide reductase subunit C (anchor subunit)
METQWPLVLFSLLAGGGAGTFAFAGLSGFFGATKKVRFIAAIIALVLLVVGGVFSIFHLGHPASVMSAVTNILSFSGISVELLLLGLSAVVVIIYVAIINREGLESAANIVGVIGVVLALVFTYALGSSYLIESQLTWNSPTLALSYMTSALALGGFLFLSIAAALKEDAALVKKVGIIALVIAVLQIIAFVAYGAFVGFGKVDAVIFWGGAVVVGSLVPVIAGAVVAFKDNTAALAYVSLIAVFVGGIAIRVLMWAVGSGFLTFFGTAAENRGLFIF